VLLARGAADVDDVVAGLRLQAQIELDRWRHGAKGNTGRKRAPLPAVSTALACRSCLAVAGDVADLLRGAGFTERRRAGTAVALRPCVSDPKVPRFPSRLPHAQHPLAAAGSGISCEEPLSWKAG
jgi:hypothetical protein